MRTFFGRLGILTAAIVLLGASTPSVFAGGSANLWPAAAAGSRANSEWRTSSYGGGKLLRRTLLEAYAVAGEVLLMGSTGVGQGSSDIRVWNPGRVTGPVGTETVPGIAGAPGTADFSCNTQRTASGSVTQRVISSRAQELAGPDTVPPSVAGAYNPCFYAAASTGVYYIGFFGPDGPAGNADGAVSADVALSSAGDFSLAQGTSVAAWDVTVRSALTSASDLTGRLFTYYPALFTGANGRPVYAGFYAVTLDGYRYKIDLRGMDPNGWISYGNQVGFFDSDGTSPIYHDAVAANSGSPGQLTTIQGNVSFQLPTFPLFFEAPAAATVAALGIPATPIAPVISGVSFGGNQGGNTTTVSSGGTFTYTSNVSGVYDFTISRDGVNFDPTLPANRRLRGIKPAGTQSVAWDGKDNSSTPFPVGTYTFHSTVHGGEYHFPFIDVENDTAGGPTITLLNPPGGTCPPWAGGCRGGFYDDRVYQTVGGTVVQAGGTVGNTLCGLDPPTTNHSDPVIGYDTASTQRAFGANPGSNTNVPCTGDFGDAKGLDIWTYTPATAAVNTAVIVPPIADIGVAKAVSTTTPALGSNITYTITATNNGPNDATGVQVTDLLPPGLVFVSSATAAGTYNPGTGLWNIGNLANGVAVTLTITATVNTTGRVTNTARKTAENESDGNPANDSASVAINPQADISLSKTVDNPTPNLGTNVTYTVTATDLGPDPAIGVKVTDLLPVGLAYVSSSTATGSYLSGTGVWSIGNLANGASATLTITATVNTTSVTVNTATKTAENEVDPVAGNNQASAAITPLDAAIGIAKTVDNATPLVGSNVQFTVTVTDHGPTQAGGIKVTDVLPPGLVYVSSSTASGAYDAGTGVWSLGLLANGAAASLTVMATVVSSSALTNTAAVTGAGQPDPGGFPHSASVSLAPIPVSDLQLTKLASSATPVIGQQLTYTLTLRNLGPSDDTGIKILDALPAGVAFASAVASQGGYDPLSGVWSVGSLANGAKATLGITVQVKSSSPVVNTGSVLASDNQDPNLANNVASATVVPTAVPGFGNDGAGAPAWPLAGLLLLVPFGLLVLAGRRSRR